MIGGDCLKITSVEVVEVRFSLPVSMRSSDGIIDETADNGMGGIVTVATTEGVLV